MVVIGKSGKQYSLVSPNFAMDRDGKTFNIHGHPDKVAKIYLTGKASQELEEKLTYMFENQPDSSVTIRITWPIDILYNNGNFVGFVMPKFGEIKDLSEAYYSNDFFDISFTKRLCIAKNLCVIIDELHRLNYICGDLNPRNICFDPNTGHTMFIGAESFHITVRNRTFRCKVGMPEYLPRELQLKMKDGLPNAALPTFTKQTDNFSLAIHIFKLLMMGYHPFSIRLKPNGSGMIDPLNIPEPYENIMKGNCPYINNSNTEYEKPKNAPDFTVLPKKLQDMFYTAFVKGHTDPSIRPTAEMWYYALDEFMRELAQCNKNPEHTYSRHLSYCPWCKLKEQYNSVKASSNNNSNPIKNNNLDLGANSDQSNNTNKRLIIDW